jgi:mono/diheme cytochrome c family protein
MLKIKNRTRPMMRRLIAAAILALGLTSIAGAAFAQGFGGYSEQSGEAIYKGICQGCHMPDAMGAKGAGAYPALAGNKKLTAKAYPVLVVVRGQKAMPEFGTSFSDEQVANVVNYVRTHFGNSYADMVTPADVKALRPTR